MPERVVQAEVEQGSLRGVETALGGTVFRGVPFARPPVGGRRFRPPEPALPWTGVRDARHFGPACPQEPMFPGLPIPDSVWDLRAPMSEDCLYLNVWTPSAGGESLPVLVWIHGGSYVQGAGSQGWFDGAALAEALDSVVVTINYRVGVFGWLRTPGAAGDPAAPQGNMGIEDQVAALAWVQSNVAAFGGDPRQVTIAGQSAGGKSVIALLAVPAASPSFQRVIAMSGGFHTDPPGRTEAMSSMVLAAAGLADGGHADLAALEQTSVLTAGTQAFQGTDTKVRWPGSRFGPVLDGETITDTPLDAIERGALDGKAIMVGTTAAETRLVPLSADQAALVESDLEEAVVELIGVDRGVAEALVGAARARGEGGDARDTFHAIESRRLYTGPADELTAAAARHGVESYRYVCDWSGPDQSVSACHGIDIALLFGTHRFPGMAAFSGQGEEVEAVVARFQGAVRSFVRRASPESGDSAWPRFAPDRPRAKLLGSGGIYEWGR